MSDLTLYIGNKNYSSWSFRPWIGLKVAGIDFAEKLVPFEKGAGNPRYKEFSPTGKVPVLVDEDLVIAESLAILDHVARKYPETGLWPRDERIRSLAMAASCEMLGGFPALRNQCPMNMRRPIKKLEQDAALAKDVARIEALWSENLHNFGGEFLFGEFSIADAMFAPVVNRLEVYELTENLQIRAYMERMKSLQAWQDWETAGINEPWIVEEDEA